MRTASWLLLPIAAIAIVAPAQAAETGNIRGKVVDDQGGPVPGATVTISGPNIAGEVSTTTAADGTFPDNALPPGEHEVHISLTNFAPAQIGVQVRLDETAYVPVTLRVAGTASEAMVVELDATTRTLDVVGTIAAADCYPDVFSIDLEGADNLAISTLSTLTGAACASAADAPFEIELRNGADSVVAAAVVDGSGCPTIDRSA